MSTVERVINQIEQSLPLEKWLNFRLVVAVSGGADSVALLRLLHLLKQRQPPTPSSALIVAHVNHGLRGSQSDSDQTLVTELARSLELNCYTTQLSVPADSSEDELRVQRYRFLVDLAHQQGARMIATGHHADDQAETILFRLCRGTGISGLAGIPQISSLAAGVSLVRPLLGIWRQEIEGVLAELGQTFCRDATNAETVYSRNFLRQEIMPAINSRFGPSFSSNLVRLAQQAREIEAFLSQQCAPFEGFVTTRSSSEVQIDCRQLALQPAILIRHFLKLVWTAQGWPLQEMNFDKWQQLASLVLQHNATTITLPGKIRCSSNDTKLVLLVS